MGHTRVSIPILVGGACRMGRGLWPIYLSRDPEPAPVCGMPVESGSRAGRGLPRPYFSALWYCLSSSHPQPSRMGQNHLPVSLRAQLEASQGSRAERKRRWSKEGKDQAHKLARPRVPSVVRSLPATGDSRAWPHTHLFRATFLVPHPQSQVENQGSKNQGNLTTGLSDCKALNTIFCLLNAAQVHSGDPG